MNESAEMTAAELNLAFAREVAGYPDSFWAGDYMDNGSAQLLPDYTKDWNAVIAEITKRGLKLEKIGNLWCVEDDGCPLCEDDPAYGECEGDDCATLARAVLDCVRAMTIEKRKHNNRENPE